MMIGYLYSVVRIGKRALDTQHVQWVATIADGTSVDRAEANVAVVALWHDKRSKTDNARCGCGTGVLFRVPF